MPILVLAAGYRGRPPFIWELKMFTFPREFSIFVLCWLYVSSPWPSPGELAWRAVVACLGLSFSVIFGYTFHHPDLPVASSPGKRLFAMPSRSDGRVLGRQVENAAMQLLAGGVGLIVNGSWGVASNVNFDLLYGSAVYCYRGQMHEGVVSGTWRHSLIDSQESSGVFR